MTVVLFEITATVSSKSALHQALSIAMPNSMSDFQMSKPLVEFVFVSAKCLKLSKIVDFYNLKGE